MPPSHKLAFACLCLPDHHPTSCITPHPRQAGIFSVLLSGARQGAGPGRGAVVFPLRFARRPLFFASPSYVSEIESEILGRAASAHTPHTPPRHTTHRACRLPWRPRGRGGGTAFASPLDRQCPIMHPSPVRLTSSFQASQEAQTTWLGFGAAALFTYNKLVRAGLCVWWGSSWARAGYQSEGPAVDLTPPSPKHDAAAAPRPSFPWTTTTTIRTPSRRDHKFAPPSVPSLILSLPPSLPRFLKQA